MKLELGADAARRSDFEAAYHMEDGVVGKRLMQTVDGEMGCSQNRRATLELVGILLMDGRCIFPTESFRKSLCFCAALLSPNDYLVQKRI